MNAKAKKVLKTVVLAYSAYTLLWCCVSGGMGFGFGLGHTPEDDEAELLEEVRHNLTGKDGLLVFALGAGFMLGDKVRRKGI